MRAHAGAAPAKHPMVAGLLRPPPGTTGAALADVEARVVAVAGHWVVDLIPRVVIGPFVVGRLARLVLPLNRGGVSLSSFVSQPRVASVVDLIRTRLATGNVAS